MNAISRFSLGAITSAALAVIATTSYAQPQSNSDMGGNTSATRIQSGAGTVPFQSLGGAAADTAVRNSATAGATTMGVTTGPRSYSSGTGTAASTDTTAGASSYNSGSASGSMASGTGSTTNNNYSGASASAPAGTVAGSSGVSSPAGSNTSASSTNNTYGTTSSATGSGGMSSNLSNTASTTDTSSSTYSAASQQPLPSEPTAAGYSSSSYSWLPYTTSGYVGLSFGSGKLDTDCAAGTNCGDAKGSVHVYTGGLFNQNFGIELGYFRLGDADRNNGKTKVSGVSLVLTGIAPLGYNFNLHGRVGGTYGWTTVEAGTGVTTVPTGDKNSFGATYGVGLSYDFTRNWSATLDWDRHHLKYAGDVRRNTDVGTIGIKYRF